MDLCPRENFPSASLINTTCTFVEPCTQLATLCCCAIVTVATDGAGAEQGP